MLSLLKKAIVIIGVVAVCTPMGILLAGDDKVGLDPKLSLDKTELGSGFFAFGEGSRSDSKGELLVGKTPESMKTSVDNANKFGTEKTGFHDPMNGKDYVQAKTTPDFQIPDFKSGPRPDPAIGPKPSGNPPGAYAPSDTKPVKDFQEGVQGGFGYNYPLLPNGMLDLSKKPVAVWKPTVPSAVLLGGEGKLCIKSICNPDLSFFADRDTGSKYVIAGRKIGGWSPFPTGTDGPRFCMNNSCVKEWKVPEKKSSQSSVPVLTVKVQENIPVAINLVQQKDSNSLLQANSSTILSEQVFRTTVFRVNPTTIQGF